MKRNGEVVLGLLGIAFCLTVIWAHLAKKDQPNPHDSLLVSTSNPSWIAKWNDGQKHEQRFDIKQEAEAVLAQCDSTCTNMILEEVHE